MKPRHLLSTLFAGALLISSTGPALASGGGDEGTEEDMFASAHLVLPGRLPAYAAGNLGIVPGTYWRIYQVLAYRAATGHPLSAQEVAALGVDRWNVGPVGDIGPGYGYASDDNGTAGWLAARAPAGTRFGLAAPANLDVMTYGEAGPYLNCPADAFRVAAATLKAREQAAGAAGAPWVKAWLQGQDAVFANCASNAQQAPALPAAVPANAPAWLKADRAYQVAAANFYAHRFTAARTAFHAIAADGASPWRRVAAYLAARCLIRSALIEFSPEPGKAAPPERARMLAQARAELAALAPSYAPAAQLVSLVDARLDPMGRLGVLAPEVNSAAITPKVVHDLQDYLRITDLQTRADLLGSKDAMTQWIAAMQAAVDDDTYSGSPTDAGKIHAEALRVARQHWQERKDALWLAPLLTQAAPGELSEAELRAAAAVPAAHPLYLTLQYHLVRLLVAHKQLARADAQLDRLFVEQGKAMPRSAHNRLMAYKMITASTRAGWLASVPRIVEDDSNGRAETMPDADFRDALLRFMPLSELKVLLAQPAFPAGLRTQMQETMMARALILHDEATALSLLDELAKTRATTRHLYARYRAAKPGAERDLAGILLLVNTPELSPHPVGDNGGASWSCTGLAPSTVPPPRYLGAEQLAEAAREQRALAALKVRTDYLGPPLIAWARTRPNDEEAPKALHFLVAATRMECGNYESAEEKARHPSVSQDAFNVLHKNYPNSSWAKATRYFY